MELWWNLEVPWMADFYCTLHICGFASLLVLCHFLWWQSRLKWDRNQKWWIILLLDKKNYQENRREASFEAWAGQGKGQKWCSALYQSIATPSCAWCFPLSLWASETPQGCFLSISEFAGWAGLWGDFPALEGRILRIKLQWWWFKSWHLLLQG